MKKQLKKMDEVTNSIDKNKVVQFHDNFKLSTIMSGEETKKEQEDFIGMPLIFNSEDFLTAKNINEEKKKIFKIIFDQN